VIVGAIRLNPNAWTELKPSFIPASDATPLLARTKAPLIVDAPRGDLQCQSSQIIGAVRWPPYYIGLGHRNRPVEPAGQVLRAAAFDRIDVAQC
jgi:hypothetical protein